MTNVHNINDIKCVLFIHAYVIKVRPKPWTGGSSSWSWGPATPTVTTASYDSLEEFYQKVSDDPGAENLPLPPLLLVSFKLNFELVCEKSQLS